MVSVMTRPNTYAKLKELDGYIGQIIQATKDAGTFDQTIFIITADHGGINKGHGGKTMNEMETPFIICGKNIKKGLNFNESMMQYDVASTIAYVFRPKTATSMDRTPDETSVQISGKGAPLPSNRPHYNHEWQLQKFYI